MTHLDINSRILASTLATVLATSALFGVVMLANPSVAEAGVTTATCRIHAVEASQDGDGTIPDELAFLADQLHAPEFSRWNKFVLRDMKEFKLEAGKVLDQKFKSGHNVKLELLGGERDKLELHTELLRSNTSLVNMDFVVGSNQIMLIPVRRGDAAIIFAYQCKS